MKSLLFFIVLALASLKLSAQALVYDPQNYSATLNQVTQTGQAVNKLTEQNVLTELTNEQINLLWHFQDSIQRERLSLQSLAGLRWADLEDFSAYVQQLGIPADTYLNPSTPHSSSLLQLLEQGTDARAANQLYRFFFPHEPSPSPNIIEQREHNLVQTNKRYAAEVLIKKQRFHQALIYLRLAEDEAQMAEELRLQLITEDAMSMTEGERIASLDAVKRSLLSSTDLRERAYQLLLLALQPNPLDELRQAQHESRLRLSSLRQEFQNLIPGYSNH